MYQIINLIRCSISYGSVFVDGANGIALMVSDNKIHLMEHDEPKDFGVLPMN